MIQYSQEFTNNIKEVVSFKGSCFLQKIYSSSRLICLVARFRGKTRFLYLGRGCGVEGFWVADKKIPVELRRIDRFLEYLRKYLCSMELLRIKQVFYDRCLHLIYRRYGQESSFIFFWKGRRLYFVNYFFDTKIDKFCIMKSWSGKEICDKRLDSLELEELFLEVGLKKDSRDKEKESYSPIESILEKERDSLIKKNNSKRKSKFLLRKLNRIRHDREAIKDANDLQEKMILGEIDFENIGKILHFNNLTIKFDLGMGVYDKRERSFKKVKAYKKAQGILDARLQQTEKDIGLLENNVINKFEKKLKIIQPYWISSKKDLEKGNKFKEDGIKVYRTGDGLSFAIGLDSSGNDYLRSKWGNSDDMWFHLDGYVGAHLVVKEKNIGNMDTGLLRVIISALADHSQLKTSEIPVVFTLVKNIKGVKGERGKVVYRKERHIKVLYDKDWKIKVD